MGIVPRLVAIERNVSAIANRLPLIFTLMEIPMHSNRHDSSEK